MPSLLSSLLQMRQYPENKPPLMAEESGQKEEGSIGSLCKLLMDMIMLRTLYKYWMDDGEDEDDGAL